MFFLRPSTSILGVEKAVFGLTLTDIECISVTLRKHPEVEKAVIYGSRAMGNYKPGSDVDLALIGNKITEEVAWDVSIELNEHSPLPYKFDVLAYFNLSNQALSKHIDQYGQILYKK